MHRIEVVGEAGEPYLSAFNGLREGAGVSDAFDAKELFREAPAPLPPSMGTESGGRS